MPTRHPSCSPTSRRARGAASVEVLVLTAFAVAAVLAATTFLGLAMRRGTECQGRAVANLGLGACERTAPALTLRSSNSFTVRATGGPSCDAMGCRGIGGANCFVAKTPVATPTGPKAIETLREGDLVLSADEATGEIAWKPVVRTFRREVPSLVELALGVDVLQTTEEHPFYVAARGWMLARDLGVGDAVVTPEGVVTVTRTASLATPATVYNVEVRDHHTYFVGTARALVHNQCANPVIAADNRTPEQRLADIYRAAALHAGMPAPPHWAISQGINRVVAQFTSGTGAANGFVIGQLIHSLVTGQVSVDPNQRARYLDFLNRHRDAIEANLRQIAARPRPPAPPAPDADRLDMPQAPAPPPRSPGGPAGPPVWNQAGPPPVHLPVRPRPVGPPVWNQAGPVPLPPPRPGLPVGPWTHAGPPPPNPPPAQPVPPWRPLGPP